MKRRRRRTSTRDNVRKLPPQRCALWVPAAKGYFSGLQAGQFVTVKYAELAQVFDENAAARNALAFRQVTGLNVTVRRVYVH